MKYSRQEILLNKTVAIVGVGAIGSLTSSQMSKEGVNLIIVDRDVVEEKNLSYQKLYSKEDIGKPKAVVAVEKLGGVAYAEDLTFENINLLDKADIVLDCTDNLETRFLINDYCLKNNKPWIYSAGLRNNGTTINFLPEKTCFRCIFNKTISGELCETAGITDTIIKNVATTQATNAVKILLGKVVSEDMTRFIDDEEEEIKIKKNEQCSACKGNFEYLKGEKGSKAVKLCGRDTYQIKGPKQKGFKIINDKVSVFKDGRALIKAKSEKEARSLYSKYVGN